MFTRRQFLTHTLNGSSLVALNAMVPQFVARTAQAAAPGKDIAARLGTISGVTTVQQTGTNHYRLTADHDVRAEAARVVVAADGALTRLSVDDPSLDAIYTRFFEKQEAREVRDAA